MSHRELKRVPLDFDHPIGSLWPGYTVDDGEDEYDPPSGDGFQLWETTSEGSPASPVFATALELAQWCESNATIYASETLPADRWLALILSERGIERGSICYMYNGYIGSLANYPDGGEA